MESNIKSTVNNTFENSLESKIDSSIPSLKKNIFLVSSIFLAVLFDRFFLNGMPGISVTIFTILFLVVFYIFNKENINLKSPVSLLLILCLISSAFNYALYTNPFMEALDFLATPILCTAAFILLRYRNHLWDRIMFYGEILFKIIISPILNIPKPFTFLKESVTRNNLKIDSRKKSIIVGIVISFFLLLIIIPLLSSADMVFSYFLKNITESLKINNLSEVVFHTVFTFIIFVYIFGYMLSFKYPQKVMDEQKTGIKRWINPITAITVLVPLSVVYLLFSIIQFSYLYGENGMPLPYGFSYAEYARRGFFELVTVTVINFTIIILVKHFADIKTTAHNKILSILLTLMTVFTFNMLFSANYKLSLYEGAYGFTYLRFFVHGFILFIFLLLVFVLAGIWIVRINIIKCCLIVSVIFFTALNFVNTDRIIAQKNIQRYEESKKIDIQYLSGLSSDSIPILADFSNTQSPEAKEIKALLLKRKASVRPDKWYEFNFSRFKALKTLKNLN